jgi:hypothetical protein
MTIAQISKKVIKGIKAFPMRQNNTRERAVQKPPGMNSRTNTI